MQNDGCSTFPILYTEAPFQIAVVRENANLLDLAATNNDISSFIGLNLSQTSSYTRLNVKWTPQKPAVPCRLRVLYS